MKDYTVIFAMYGDTGNPITAHVIAQTPATAEYAAIDHESGATGNEFLDYDILAVFEGHLENIAD